MADNNLATNCEECQEPQTTCCTHTHKDKCITVTVDLDCANIPKGKTLDEVLVQLDAYLCTLKDLVQNSGSFTIQNVGQGTGIFKGVETTNERSFRSLVSDTIDISLDSENKEVRLEANYPTVPDVTTTQLLDIQDLPNSTNTNAINIIHEQNSNGDYIIKGIVSESISISEDINGNIKMEVVLPEGFEQEQADLLEDNETLPTHIKNSVPTKVETSDFTIDSTYKHYVVAVENGANPVQINLNNITETDNFFVGFIQKGSGDVSFTTNSIVVPSGRQAVIEGTGHNAAIEVINGTIYLLGSLKQSI